MSEEQLKAFLEKLQGDAAMQEKLKTAVDADALVAISEQAGFVICVDTLNQSQSELSEEELEGVGGGTAFVVWSLMRPLGNGWCH